MSNQGSKYINKEIQNAVKGVKEIKNLIEKTNEERKTLLTTLEKAKKKKEVRVTESRALTLPLPAGREGPCRGPLLGCHGESQSSLGGVSWCCRCRGEIGKVYLLLKASGDENWDLVLLQVWPEARCPDSFQ